MVLRAVPLFVVLLLLKGCWVLNSGTCTLEPASLGARRVDPESLLEGVEAYGPDCIKVLGTRPECSLKLLPAPINVDPQSLLSGSKAYAPDCTETEGTYKVKSHSVTEWWQLIQTETDFKSFFSGDSDDLKSPNGNSDSALRIRKTAGDYLQDFVCRSQSQSGFGFSFCGSRSGIGVGSDGLLPAGAFSKSREFDILPSASLPVRYHNTGANVGELLAPVLTRPISGGTTANTCEVSEQSLSAQINHCEVNVAPTARLKSASGQGLGFVDWRLVFRKSLIGADCSVGPCAAEVWLNSNTGQLYWMSGHSIYQGHNPPSPAINFSQISGNSPYSCSNPGAGNQALWRSLKGGLTETSSIKVRWRVPSRSEIFLAFSDGFDILFTGSNLGTVAFWTQDFLGDPTSERLAFTARGVPSSRGTSTELTTAVCIGSVDPSSW